jgi:hypothetical protein
MKKGYLSLAVIAVVSLLGGALARTAYRYARKPFAPYTLVLQATDYDASGNGTPAWNHVRHVSADGRIHELRTWTNGYRLEVFGEPGKGLFAVKSDHLQFMSSLASEPETVTDEQYQASPQFAGFETVGGVHAVKQRLDDRIVIYRAPSLNKDLIKWVEPFGNGVTRVIEPVSIVHGEPEAAAFNHPELPVRYDVFEQTHPGAAHP